MQLIGERHRGVLWAAFAIILLLFLIVPPGFFSVDEAIYYLGARAVAEGGSLGIANNGFDQFDSEALKLRLLIDGPHGLTPQYPAGSALIAAPLVPLLGPRSLILLNAIAAALLLVTVWRICLRQFGSEKVACVAVALLMFATFWLEYAVAVWPHMLAAYFALQAYWFALRHVQPEESGYRNAIAAGLFAGAGILFRLDAALAVPAIALILIIYARQLLGSLIGFGAGVLPFIALAAWLNYLKFGSLNPFSYGQSGGNTDVAAYLPLLAVLCIAFGGLILWRRFAWRANPRTVLFAAIVVAIALLAVPATNIWLLRLWKGFISLIVDVNYVHDGRTGVEVGTEGTTLFWNLPKKALGQSMPWIGMLAVLIGSGFRQQDRQTITTLLIFIATMTMPFILLSWHGGSGGNMRYFLPVLPALSILCARIACDMWLQVSNAMVYAVAGLWAAIVLCLAWAFLHPSGFAGVHQILSTYVFLVTAVAALAAGFPSGVQQSARKLAIALLGSGLLMAMSFAVSDFKRTTVWRAEALNVSQSLSRLPPRSLVITFPEWAAERIPGNGSILATRDAQTRQIDVKLINDALDAGYRVFVDSFEFDAARDLPAGMEYANTGYRHAKGRWIELRRPPRAVRHKDSDSRGAR